MSGPEGRGSYSAWWLVVMGLALSAIGVTFAALNAANLFDVNHASLILGPVTIGPVLVIVGIIWVLKRKRIDY